jgi:fructokinase
MGVLAKKTGCDVAETIVVVGEALMDCARSVSGGAVSEIPGGSPMNVAIGLGRLGYHVVLAARVGSDDFGTRMVEHIRGSHVDLIPAATGLGKTSRATALLAADGSASYEFDLEWDLTPDMVEPGEYLHVHTGSIGATLAPGADAVREILERERRAGATISYDPNARPRIMGEADDVRQQMEALIALSDIVKASDEDIEWLYPHWSTNEVVAHWKALGVVLVVITTGTSGATAWGAGAPVLLPTQAHSVVDTIGAGDTVMSGLISALADSGRLGSAGRQKLAELTGDELADVLNFALAAAAITVSRAGANPPTRAEMDKVV